MDTRLISLRTKIEPLLRPYFRHISVFGSYARSESTSQSNVDLLVVLKPSENRPPFGLFELIRLEKELEKKLGCAVDLVTEARPSPRTRLHVEKDRLALYEEIYYRGNEQGQPSTGD